MRSFAAKRRARRIGIGFVVFAAALVVGHFASVGRGVAGLVVWPVGASVKLNIKASDLGLDKYGTRINIDFDESWRTHVAGVAGLPIVATRTRRVVAEYIFPEDGPALGDPDPIRGLLKKRSVLLPELSARRQMARGLAKFNPAAYMPGPPAGPLGVMPGYRSAEERDFDECVAMVNGAQPAIHSTDVYWGNLAASVVVMVASQWSLLVAAVFGGLGTWLWTGNKAFPPGHCLACGYDLRATPTDKPCPECGTLQRFQDTPGGAT